MPGYDDSNRSRDCFPILMISLVVSRWNYSTPTKVEWIPTFGSVVQYYMLSIHTINICLMFFALQRRTASLKQRNTCGMYWNMKENFKNFRNKFDFSERYQLLCLRVLTGIRLNKWFILYLPAQTVFCQLSRFLFIAHEPVSWINSSF